MIVGGVGGFEYCLIWVLGFWMMKNCLIYLF